MGRTQQFDQERETGEGVAMKITIYKPDSTPVTLFEYGSSDHHVMGWSEAAMLRNRLTAFLDTISETEWNRHFEVMEHTFGESARKAKYLCDNPTVEHTGHIADIAITHDDDRAHYILSTPGAGR